jgi:hypothetical protein
MRTTPLPTLLAPAVFGSALISVLACGPSEQHDGPVYEAQVASAPTSASIPSPAQRESARVVDSAARAGVQRELTALKDEDRNQAWRGGDVHLEAEDIHDGLYWRNTVHDTFDIDALIKTVQAENERERKGRADGEGPEGRPYNRARA